MRGIITGWKLQHALRSTWIPYAGIMIAVALVYGRTLFYGYTYFDDTALIQESYPFLRNIRNIPSAFTQEVFFNSHSSQSIFYRPLLTISFLLDAQFGVSSLFVFHLINILLHVLASCLLFLLLQTLGVGKRRSFFASLFFALHPTLNQVVAWIPGRNESLLTVLVISGFFALTQFCQKNTTHWYVFHLIFVMAALLTKETAIVMFVLFTVYLFLLARHLSTKKYAVLVAGWGVAVGTYWLLRENALHADAKVIFPGMKHVLFTNTPAILLYVGKALFPFHLSGITVITKLDLFLGGVALVCILGVSLFTYRKQYKLLLFGGSWFLLFLLPTLSVPKNLTAYNETRLYLPLVGLLILLLTLTSSNSLQILQRGVGILFMTIVFLAWTFLTVLHSSHFRDGFTFWSHAADVAPQVSLVHSGLGSMYAIRGETAHAEKEYQEALTLNPREPDAYNNLGTLYFNQGRLNEAEIVLKKELSLYPNSADAYFNLGIVYQKQGKYEDAEKSWKKTLKINPRRSQVRNNLGILYSKKGQNEEAKKMFLEGTYHKPG